jgi:hypothetical protein
MNKRTALIAGCVVGVVGLLVLVEKRSPEGEVLVELRDANNGKRLRNPECLFSEYIGHLAAEDLKFVPRFLRCHRKEETLLASNGIVHVPNRIVTEMERNATGMLSLSHEGYYLEQVSRLNSLQHAGSNWIVIPMSPIPMTPMMREIPPPPNL